MKALIITINELSMPKDEYNLKRKSEYIYIPPDKKKNQSINQNMK